MFLTLFGEKLNGTDPEDVIKNAFACFDDKSLGEWLVFVGGPPCEVKASASGAENAGFESRWSTGFFRVESYQ